MAEGNQPPTTAGWQTGEPYGEGRRAGLSRGMRLFIAGSFFLATAGAVVAIILYMRQPAAAHILTIPVSQYSDPPWPANPWAEEDSDALQAVLPTTEISRDKAFGAQEAGRLEARLRKLADDGDTKPIIVHLSALAVVDDGVVYVLPADAKPGRKQDWVSVDDILNAVQNSKSPHRLLLLDIAHPVAGPFRGILTDKVAERLDDLLTLRASEGKLPFFVITSCSKGEFSTPMDEEQLSAFVFYVAAGLRGAADGCGGRGKVDHHVSVDELHDYVQSRVQRWSWNCRGKRQTPRLYANANLEDFDLNYQNQSSAEPAKGRTYPDWLFKEWEKRDRWIARSEKGPNSEAYREAPMAFNTLQAALMRLERDWHAFGRDDQITRLQDSLKRDVENAERARESTRGKRATKLRSLAAAPQPVSLPEEWSRLLDSYVAARIAASTVPKDKDPDKVHEKAQKDREELLKLTKDRKTDASILIWRRLVEDEAPTRQRVIELSGLLDAVQPEETTESHVARRLAAWRGPREPQKWATAARQYLRTENSACRAIVLGPAAIPWAKDLLTEALRQQAEGERLMFASGEEQLVTAKEQLAKAAAKFESAHLQLERGQEARRAYEDAAVELLALADLAAEDADVRRIWQDVVDAMARLADWLVKSPAGNDIPLNDWEDATNRLNVARQKLRAPYQPDEVNRRVADWGPGGVAEYQKLTGLLHSPLVPAKERVKVWNAARAIGRKLHDQTREADTSDDQIHRTPMTLEPSPSRDELQSQRRQRRANVAVELLRAAGSDRAEKVSAAMVAAAAGTDEAKWKALGSSLQSAWSDELPKQVVKLEEQKDWPAADRRERFLPIVAATAGLAPGAAVELRKRDVEVYSAWLKDYYRAMGQLRGGDPAAAAFYDKAAKEI